MCFMSAREEIWEMEIKGGEGLWWLVGRVESLFDLGIDAMEIYVRTTAVAGSGG